MSTSVTDPLNIARELILRPSGLDDTRLDRVFGEVLRHSVDYADVYFQLSREESWALEDGIVKDGSASIEQVDLVVARDTLAARIEHERRG